MHVHSHNNTRATRIRWMLYMYIDWIIDKYRALCASSICERDRIQANADTRTHTHTRACEFYLKVMHIGFFAFSFPMGAVFGCANLNTEMHEGRWWYAGYCVRCVNYYTLNQICISYISDYLFTLFIEINGIHYSNRWSALSAARVLYFHVYGVRTNDKRCNVWEEETLYGLSDFFFSLSLSEVRPYVNVNNDFPTFISIFDA